MSLPTVLKKKSSIWMDYFLSHQNQISIQKITRYREVCKYFKCLIIYFEYQDNKSSSCRKKTDFKYISEVRCNLIQASVLQSYKAAREDPCATQGLHCWSLDQGCTVRLSQGHSLALLLKKIFLWLKLLKVQETLLPFSSSLQVSYFTLETAIKVNFF